MEDARDADALFLWKMMAISVHSAEAEEIIKVRVGDVEEDEDGMILKLYFKLEFQRNKKK